MTSTADRVYGALVCEETFTHLLGGDDAWDHILTDPGPLTDPAASVQVDAPPTVLDALVYPNETAERLARLVPSAASFPPPPRSLRRLVPSAASFPPPPRSLRRLVPSAASFPPPPRSLRRLVPSAASFPPPPWSRLWTC